VKTLKIVGTTLALIFCLELQAYEASVFLKRQWSEGINRMCQYQDGTVLPTKTRSCPSRKPKAGSEPYVVGSKLAETLAANRRQQSEQRQVDVATQSSRESDSLTFQERMKWLEHQKTLHEIEMMTIKNDKPEDFQDMFQGLQEPSVRGMGVFCDVPSDIGVTHRLFYASSCPIGATQVD